MLIESQTVPLWLILIFFTDNRNLGEECPLAVGYGFSLGLTSSKHTNNSQSMQNFFEDLKILKYFILKISKICAQHKYKPKLKSKKNRKNFSLIDRHLSRK